jgi:hypothetical protein
MPRSHAGNLSVMFAPLERTPTVAGACDAMPDFLSQSGATIRSRK